MRQPFVQAASGLRADMSYNKHGEYELCKWVTETGAYFISRDRAGNHVLREGSSDGKELFSPVRDDGKKNTKTGRVLDVGLLYMLIGG